MQVRSATNDDWPAIFRFYAAVMAEGKTYAFPPNQTIDEARPWWMASAPDRTVVATAADDPGSTNSPAGTIIGSAKMGPNRPGRGSHIATASFLVDPAHQGKGVGRVLGEHVLEWARAEGFHGIQFNAVVESNAPAVRLWTSLGFEIIGTVPEAFDHPDDGLVGLHVMHHRLR